MTKDNRFQRILLIVPPFYRLIGGKNNWINLGLSYIGAVLDEQGYYIRIYNADHEDRECDVSLEEVFKGHQKYIEVVNNESNPIWQEISDKIREFRPDLVGISIVFSATLKTVKHIARIVKQYNSEIKVVVGGPHATIAPEETLSYKFFDYLVRGEGEYTLLELVQGKELTKIEGLSYKNEKGEIIHNFPRKFIENLDELPFPKLGLQYIPIKEPNENFGVIATSRGCPNRCVFCSSPKLWGRKVRHRSIDNVLEEIKQRYYKHGVCKYYFSDDNFNLDKKYAKKLCRAIINSGLKIEFICEVIIGRFDRELMELMKAAGCKRLKFGMESGSDRILKLMKKGINVEQIRQTCALAKEVGIDYTIYVMLGMPTETLEEMHQTLELAKELDAKYISLSIAMPQLGTELYEMALSMGISVPTADWEEFYHQSSGTVLNSNVDYNIIEEFLTLNKKEDKERTI